MRKTDRKDIYSYILHLTFVFRFSKMICYIRTFVITKGSIAGLNVSFHFRGYKTLPTRQKTFQIINQGWNNPKLIKTRV